MAFYKKLPSSSYIHFPIIHSQKYPSSSVYFCGKTKIEVKTCGQRANKSIGSMH